VIGLAGMPYRVRRGLVALMDLSPDVLAPASAAITTITPVTGGETAPPSTSALPAAEPSFRAPWGEIERELPYVTITTQPWPEEWWRPAARRTAVGTVDAAADAIARATDTPTERMTRSAVAVPVEAAHSIAIKPIAKPEPAHETPAPETPKAKRTPASARKQAPRRGGRGRLVVVAGGLVLSLIAVESASRRRH
jgi:hypothetical protein